MPSPRGSAASRSTVSGLAKTQHLHGPASEKLDQARVGVLERTALRPDGRGEKAAV
ncbi:hypothetical protein ACFWAY_52835 [Rhodococcus sp. NPDC059968]|uniref:hypothetical protein n=1 Tax=Rhodococcus sp. NPDC059968 TaxID=3347017 RepID=UPI00366F9185